MRWTLPSKPDSQQVQNLQSALQVDTTIATLLLQRGIRTFEEAKTFFRPTLADLHDPYLMQDMQLLI